MYSKRSGLIIGFHGCDIEVRDTLINSSNNFQISENNYDWLGHGMYFWEHNLKRALDFAKFKKGLPLSDIKTPAVVGAVINLGYCLDLLDSESIRLLKISHEMLTTSLTLSGLPIPKNSTAKTGRDLIFRKLDCSVIETLHENRQIHKLEEFDSVRGVFWEGKRVYKTAGFGNKNHIQICVRNPNCIKAFFLPRTLDRGSNKV